MVRHLGTDPYPTFDIGYGSVPNIGTDPYSIYYLGTDRYGSVPNSLSWVRIHTERKPTKTSIGYGSELNVILGMDPYPMCHVGYGSVPRC